METIERMMATSPSKGADRDRRPVVDCVAACLECELACVACADACLGENNVSELRRCIRLNLDCADICASTARMLSRLGDADAELSRHQLELCALACATCGAECQQHAQHHEHCRVCMEACLRCERACRAALLDGEATLA